jgi:redox-sensing transcriptional repressor
MNGLDVPDIIVSRLPIYLRALQYMAGTGSTTTSSQELGDKVGISAAQIRKDLSQFGEFGKQGTGYHIPFLIERLQQILKVEVVWDVVLVGMGELGHAILRYQGFSHRGFKIVACFDSDPAKVGTQVGAFTIGDVKNIASPVKEARIKMAMLCVPAAAAQPVTDKLVEAGIKGILNYAPVSLTVPAEVRVQYIDPVIGLQRMAYYMAEK